MSRLLSLHAASTSHNVFMTCPRGRRSVRHFPGVKHPSGKPAAAGPRRIGKRFPRHVTIRGGFAPMLQHLLLPALLCLAAPAATPAQKTSEGKQRSVAELVKDLKKGEQERMKALQELEALG